MPKILEQKGLTKVVKIWCHDNAGFFVEVSNGCQKGYYDVKMNETGQE
jgi:hypothetical protein